MYLNRLGFGRFISLCVDVNIFGPYGSAQLSFAQQDVFILPNPCVVRGITVVWTSVWDIRRDRERTASTVRKWKPEGRLSLGNSGLESCDSCSSPVTVFSENGTDLCFLVNSGGFLYWLNNGRLLKTVLAPPSKADIYCYDRFGFKL